MDNIKEDLSKVNSQEMDCDINNLNIMSEEDPSSQSGQVPKSDEDLLKENGISPCYIKTKRLTPREIMSEEDPSSQSGIPKSDEDLLKENGISPCYIKTKRLTPREVKHFSRSVKRNLCISYGVKYMQKIIISGYEKAVNEKKKIINVRDLHKHTSIARLHTLNYIKFRNVANNSVGIHRFRNWLTVNKTWVEYEKNKHVLVDLKDADLCKDAVKPNRFQVLIVRDKAYSSVDSENSSSETITEEEDQASVNSVDHCEDTSPKHPSECAALESDEVVLENSSKDLCDFLSESSSQSSSNEFTAAKNNVLIQIRASLILESNSNNCKQSSS